MSTSLEPVTTAQPLAARPPASTQSVVVTLFEGDYHLGAAALINSLVAAGFAGVVVCGHRGPRPPWAAQAEKLGPVSVHFVAVETGVHFTNYKPDFLLQVWHHLEPQATRLYYFDPDITVRVRWSFFEEWADYGVALVEDVNSPLSETHPRRGAWRRCLEARKKEVQRETPLYVNGGFIGLSRTDEPFLHEWKGAMELVGQEIGGLAGSMFSFDTTRPEFASPAYPFNKTDQDALNIAVMTTRQRISVMGPEGMDFRPGGWTMSHALGAEKPWRKHFIRAALAGRPPSRADREFWAYASSPIGIFSSGAGRWRMVTLRLASFLGRFYRRA